MNKQAILQAMKELLNDKGRLDCGVAFKLADKFGINVEEIGKIASDNDIRIDNCELGQFGGLEFDKADAKLLKSLESISDEKRRVFCKDAREFAKQNGGLKLVRSTLKDHKIDVKYCQLGCFKEKKGKQFVVRTKIWVENADGELVFGSGKTELLGLIHQTGSILKASKLMGLSYKKAWTHIQILQNNMKEELILAKQGRPKESDERTKTRLTPRALELMEDYRALQRETEDFIKRRFVEIFLKKKKGQKS